MVVYRICWPQFADDLTGQGAYLYGGRWNFKGERILYTATNPSLALLEMLVHLPVHLIQTRFSLVTIEVKTKELDVLKPKELPHNWRDNDAPESLKQIGSAFLKHKKMAGLLVPSVVMPKDMNLLINPILVSGDAITIVEKEDMELEKRLLSNMQ